MTLSKGKIAQLQRARDAAKRDMDDVMMQREQHLLDSQRLQDESVRVQDALQRAISLGDPLGAREARTRLSAVNQRREELTETVALLGGRLAGLQRQFGEAHDKLRHAEEDVTWMRNRIAVRREQIRKAQGEASPRLAELERDLAQCQERYRDLTGEYLPEETSAAA